MVDQEDEEMKMVARQNLQHHESPEPKRSKPRENPGAGGEAAQPEESPEASQRRKQRELMAAAAEKRMAAAKTAAPAVGKSVGSGKDVKFEDNRLAKGENVPVAAVKNVESVRDGKIQGSEGSSRETCVTLEKMECTSGIADTSLSVLEADELFLMIFGNRVTKDVLAQWTNQGIRFSDDPETSMGLVQHEGGPCGVLAAIQDKDSERMIGRAREQNDLLESPN